MKKIANFRWFFDFEVQYLRNRWSDFSQFFANHWQFCLLFRWKKESFKEFQNFEKKFEMLKVYPKTANLATLPNFDVIEKNGWRIWNQRPKINKVWLVSDKVYFCCWPVLFIDQVFICHLLAFVFKERSLCSLLEILHSYQSIKYLNTYWQGEIWYCNKM